MTDFWLWAGRCAGRGASGQRPAGLGALRPGVGRCSAGFSLARLCKGWLRLGWLAAARSRRSLPGSLSRGGRGHCSEAGREGGDGAVCRPSGWCLRPGPSRRCRGRWGRDCCGGRAGRAGPGVGSRPGLSGRSSGGGPPARALGAASRGACSGPARRGAWRHGARLSSGCELPGVVGPVSAGTLRARPTRHPGAVWPGPGDPGQGIRAWGEEPVVWSAAAVTSKGCGASCRRRLGAPAGSARTGRAEAVAATRPPVRKAVEPPPADRTHPLSVSFCSSGCLFPSVLLCGRRLARICLGWVRAGLPWAPGCLAWLQRPPPSLLWLPGRFGAKFGFDHHRGGLASLAQRPVACSQPVHERGGPVPGFGFACIGGRL